MNIERLTERYHVLVDGYALRDTTLLTMFLVVGSLFIAWALADTPLIPVSLRRVLRTGFVGAALVILLVTLGYSLVIGGGYGAA